MASMDHISGPPRAQPVPCQVAEVFSPHRLGIQLLQLSGGDVQNLEEKLARIWTHDGLSLDKAKEPPTKGMHVLLKPEEQERCRRGYILDIYETPEEGKMYEIFLYDYGTIRTLKKCDLNQTMQLTDEYVVEVGPRARILTIAGIKPCKVKSIPNGPSRVMRSTKWRAEALSFVKIWTGVGNFGYVSLRIPDELNVFGDLYKREDDIPLSKTLTLNQNAIFDDSLFHLQVDGTDLRLKPFKTCDRHFVRASTHHLASGGAESLSASRDNPQPSTSDSGRQLLTSTKISKPGSGLRPQSARFGELLKSTVTKPEPTVPSSSFITPKSFLSRGREDQAQDCLMKDTPVKTLMRGKNLLKPLAPGGLNEFVTHASISDALKKGFAIQQLNSLQRCVWPHVLRGRNCTIIGGATKLRGKTMSYLVPIASIALSEVESLRAGFRPGDLVGTGKGCWSNVGERKGPVGLILCSTLKSGEKIGSQLDRLVEGSKLTTYVTNGTETRNKVRAMLHGNPDFVIATADFALDLYKNYFDLFRLERLRFLVFDDSHAVLKENCAEVKELIKHVNNHICQEGANAYVQTVFCGQEWTDEVASATVKTCEDALLFIGSPMEALKYGCVDIQVHFIHDLDRIKQLHDVYEDPSKLPRKTIIFCSSAKSVDAISVNLYRVKGITTRNLTDDEKGTDALRDIMQFWWTLGPDERVVLVVMDKVFKEMDIRNADCVIHFELPLKKQDAFGERHMCMWDHFPDVTAYSEEGEDALVPKTDLTSHVFITPNDEDMYKVVFKLKKIDVEIDERLMELAETLQLEASQNIRKMCEKLEIFGKCKDVSCKARHVFTPDDFAQESVIPKTGRVEVEVKGIDHANAFLVKLQHYYEVERGTRRNNVSYINKGRALQQELNSYFSDGSKLVNCATVKVGMKCIVRLHKSASPDQECVRGRIARFMQLDDTVGGKQPTSVRVFCIDIGDYVIRPPADIYTLPEQFAAQPPLCIKVILANLKPRSGEPDFPSQSRSSITRFVQGNIYTGKIVLSIGETVWVHPLLEHSRTAAGDWMIKNNVRTEIIKVLKLAENNPDHMKVLYKLCENVEGVSCAAYEAPAELDYDFADTHFMEGDKIEWAHIPLFSSDRDDLLVKVECTCVQNPVDIYVNQLSFAPLVDNLNKELHKEVTDSIQLKYENYATIFSSYYGINMAVAAREPVEQTWNRALIVESKNQSTEEGEGLYKVFFVDYGDFCDLTTKDLHPITKKFVDRLPFQAISVSLEHVIPFEEGAYQGQLFLDRNSIWQRKEDVGDFLNELLLKDGIGHKFDLSAFSSLGRMDYDDHVRLCKRYAVLALLDDNKELGELLVGTGLAKFDRGGEEAVTKFKKTLLQKFNEAYDRSLPKDDEDDGDDGGLNESDFEFFCGDNDPEGVQKFLECVVPPEVAQKMAVAVVQGSAHPTPVPTLLTASAEPDAKLGSAPTPEMPKEKKTKSLDQKPPKDGTLNPALEWSQRPETITLRISVPDLTSYTINVNESSSLLEFRSESPPNYASSFELYARACMDSKVQSGQVLTVKLLKFNPGPMWERLTHVDDNIFRITRDKVGTKVVEEPVPRIALIRKKYNYKAEDLTGGGFRCGDESSGVSDGSDADSDEAQGSAVEDE